MERNYKILLYHSAQCLDNISPTIIYENKSPVPLEQEEKRQQIVSDINNTVMSSQATWSQSSNVTIYYTPQNFVIESIPNQMDSYNRLSPILTYGYFPNQEKDKEDWIEEVSTGINDFVQSIGRELSSTTKEMIKKGLKETTKKSPLKQYQSIFFTKPLNYAGLFGATFVIPLLLGGILHQQIPQLLNQQLLLFPPDIQRDTLMALKPVIQQLIMRIGVLIAINNVILLGLVLLMNAMMKSGFKAGKK